MMGVVRVGVAVVIVLGLGACATLPATQSNTPAATNTTFQEAAEFELAGRLSIRQNDRLDSVKIEWIKTSLEERLKFFTPFGSQLAELTKINRENGSAEVTLNTGKEMTRAESINALTEAALGVALDVEQIARWVQGVGLLENTPKEFPLRDGSVWHVTAERFQIMQEKYRYAARISAVKNSGDISLKLVIDEWRAK